MNDDLLGRVIRVLAETQRIPVQGITKDSTFEELKIDSLDAIQIIFAIETEFNINISDDAAKSVRTVGDLADGVERLIAGA